MIAIPDTNFFVKYYLGQKSLGLNAKAVFEDKNTFLIIPSMVLVELKYLIAKGRVVPQILDEVFNLLNEGNVMVYPLDKNVVPFISTELNIHDGIIYGTALMQSENFHTEIMLLTSDSGIKKLKQSLVKIVW